MTEFYIHEAARAEISRRLHELRREAKVANAIAECVLEVLYVREVEVPPDARTFIRSHPNPNVVLPWLSRSVIATSVSDLFIDDQV
ncbi:hypothetical protein AB0M22_06310 [Nocardia sp. NPDC051756]|uniref:hypothetical protein n=1 Tax=Nocardia sp. NPDC051756 TaxID=3154751 RepID=UPI00341873DB